VGVPGSPEALSPASPQLQAAPFRGVTLARVSDDFVWLEDQDGCEMWPGRSARVPDAVPTWDEAIAALMAKLPALVAQEARVTINDARTIQHLAEACRSRAAG